MNKPEKYPYSSASVMSKDTTNKGIIRPNKAAVNQSAMRSVRSMVRKLEDAHARTVNSTLVFR